MKQESAPRTVVLLVNLGTPEAKTTSAVRRFLRSFLSDARVIDAWPPLRWLLGGLLIPLFRAPASAAAYRAIWTEEGSPLANHTEKLAKGLQEYLDSASTGNVEVRFAMRYGRPSLKAELRALQGQPIDRFYLLPLYPQPASSSTGTVIELAFREMAKWPVFPGLTQIISSFYDGPGFLDLWVRKLTNANWQSYDRVIFSFHGLPWRHITAGQCAAACRGKGPSDCAALQIETGRFCYRAACYATARGIATRASVPKEHWEVAFQSRLGSGWIEPFTDRRVEELAQQGVRRILVLCPAFVTDCLETLEEVEIRLRASFVACGGDELSLVHSLNSDPQWVEVLATEVLRSESLLVQKKVG